MNCIGINKITNLTKPKVTVEMSAKDNISTLVIWWLLKNPFGMCVVKSQSLNNS